MNGAAPDPASLSQRGRLTAGAHHGTSLRADRPPGQGGVDDPGDQLVPSRQQVAVGVDGRGDRLVAQSCLDVRQRGAAGDEPGDVGVAEVVEPERRDALGRERLHQLAPDVGVEVAVVQRQPVAGGEHEVVGLLALDPPPQHRGHCGRDGDGAP